MTENEILNAIQKDHDALGSILFDQEGAVGPIPTALATALLFSRKSP